MESYENSHKLQQKLETKISWLFFDEFQTDSQLGAGGGGVDGGSGQSHSSPPPPPEPPPVQQEPKKKSVK